MYAGEWMGGKPHGVGNKKKENGALKHGMWKKGKKFKKLNTENNSDNKLL